MGRRLDLENRTSDFALRIVRLYRSLPNSAEAQVIGKQLLRAGTSVGANYRAVERSRSRADFISKLGIVLEEADEVDFWLNLLVRADIFPRDRLSGLLTEINELIAIFVASQKTAKAKPRS